MVQFKRQQLLFLQVKSASYMFMKFLKKLLGIQVDDSSTEICLSSDAFGKPISIDAKVELTAILIDAALADGASDPNQEKIIKKILYKTFGVSEDVPGIIENAKLCKRSQETIFGDLARRYSRAQRLKILELITTIAFADDNDIDRYEDRLLKRYTIFLQLPSELAADSILSGKNQR